jgi:hypothetical protein
MRRLLNRLLRKTGYEITKLRPSSDGGSLYFLHSFRKSDGTFDAERYRRVQQQGNEGKIHKTWVIEGNIEFLAGYLRQTLGEVRFGICHGTRRGNEQKWFRQYLGCDVIGTEISESAREFPHTIQWDFHDENPEWLGKADFVYSNSFDHTHDPDACLNTWVRSLRPGGLCILEHSSFHAPDRASEMDPFGVELEVLPYLIATWGQDRFFLRRILPAPHRDPKLRSLVFLVIQRSA